MKPTDNHTFHFLSEISKENNYRLLFPDSKAGMAVIWLFEKIENGLFPGNTFKESDIHEALRKVNANSELTNSRHPKEHYNSLISELQEYFFRYDEERQQYSFKVYAYIFCKHAKDTLKSFFDPTQIEKICFNLREKLSNSKTEIKLTEWFATEFATFKPQLKGQLDYLDKQIDQSVAELRENKKLNLQQGIILETLRQIDERFEIIRKQNKELRTAFREIEQIRKLIDSYTIEFDNDKLHNYAHEAITFFQDMRQILSFIDKRLDRIQPRIKQLFSNLNKPLFNTRVEKFIAYLINKSIESTRNNKKILLLPENIPHIVLQEEILDFIMVERKSDLFPLKPKRRLIVHENPILKEKAFAATINQVHQQDSIAQWIGIIQKDINIHGQLNLAPYFFRIFNEKSDDQSLILAIAVVYRAMRHFEQSNLYEIIINPNKVAKDNDKKTFLWEMIIKQK